MVKVSVVIPVYNVEKYLRDCLDTIVNQTLTDIEIICVNDGSPDNSLDILNEYASKDKRITVLSQENGGHAVATNNGMKLAKGKYLYLMDSDDMLKLDALEKAYNAAEEKNVDFVLFQAINYDDTKDKYYKAENYSMNAVAEKVGDKIFNHEDLGTLAMTVSVTPWTKLYKRKFIEINNITFPEGLIFEDNVFFWEVYFSAKRICFLKEHLFYRRWYANSSTKAGDRRFLDSIEINSMIIDVFKKYDVLTDDFKVKLYNRKISLTFIRFLQIKEEFKQEFFDRMQANFKEWVNDADFYNYLTTILIPRNKQILDYVLTSKNPKQLDLLVKNYDLSLENYNLTNRKENNKKELKNLKNENKFLNNKIKDLTGTLEKTEKLNKELKSSHSWKYTKPLRNAKQKLK